MISFRQLSKLSNSVAWRRIRFPAAKAVEIVSGNHLSLSPIRLNTFLNSTPRTLMASSHLQFIQNRHKSTKTDSTVSTSITAEGFEDLDKPVKFTTSKAAEWKAVETLGGDPFPDSPWYQPFVVSFSVAIFLLYFLYLREESDIDEDMKIPLWERVPGLENQQLQNLLVYNTERGLPTEDIKNRLEELKKKRDMVKNS